MATRRADTIRGALVSVWLAACGGQGPHPSATAPTPPSPAPAEAPSAADSTEPRFQMTRAMIPMRDGASLETVIFSPSSMPKALPMLLVRTPYGIPKDDRSVRSEWYAPLRADGYIFVFQNLRGRFGSSR
jgi:predicted acyl esterase